MQTEMFLPVRVNMMRTANMSGYSASTPGAFIDMCSLQNSSMRFPTNSSKVALHARATLEVPGAQKVQRSFSNQLFPLNKTV